MNGRIGTICGLLLLALCGCRNGLDEFPERNVREEIPVRFTAERPQDDASVRAIVNKETFVVGDVMHVSAVFTLDNEQEETVTKYACLTLDESGEWNNETIFDMGWPWNAKRAKFTAYYLENWNGPIATTGTPLDAVVLDRFESDERSVNPDPLMAETTVEGYGKAVHLCFKHLCTRLTVEDVGDEAEYEYELRSKPMQGTIESLKNACQLTLNEDHTLTFEFVTEQSAKVSSQVFETANGKRAVTFHLAPGDYSRFSLTRRNGYAYLSLTNVDKLKDLQENKAYTVSLENLQGNITPDDDEVWTDKPVPDPVPEYQDFDRNKFLKAICECKEDYVCKLKDGTSTVVLKKADGRNEMLLMQDVDFEGEDFAALDLPNTVTFDGGGHSILRVAHPIFQTIYGTVTQLNIYAETENGPLQVRGDQIEWGMLARVLDRGELNNIRLKDTQVEFTIPNTQDTGGKTYNIGALIGWVKSGSLSVITLEGNISVTVDSEYRGDYLVNVGGVVGQFSGSIEHVDNFGGNSLISVTNKCKGYSSRYTGGLVGVFNEATLHHCNLNARVDADESSGTWNYAGGIAGAVRTTSKSSMSAAIEGMSVTGSVRGGRIMIGSGTTTHSSTGGIVGHVQSASVTEGIALNKVSVAEHADLGENSFYTVGGVIGSMTNAVSICKNEGRMSFKADGYTLPGYRAGTFCGGGGSTEGLLADGNTAEGTGRFVGSDQ